MFVAHTATVHGSIPPEADHVETLCIYRLLRRGDGQAGTKGNPYVWNWSRRNTIWTLSCSPDKGKRDPC